jgi:hypothetical protein
MTPMTHVLELQRLQPDVHPMNFEQIFVSGISSICPPPIPTGNPSFEE